MPPNPQVSAAEIPVLTESSTSSKSLAKRSAWNEARLRQGYDQELVEHHLDLVDAGEAPNAQDQNVERSRTSIVGPPPNGNPNEGETGPPNQKEKMDKKGKGRQKTWDKNSAASSSMREINTTEIAPVQRSSQRAASSSSSSQPSAGPSSLSSSTPSTSNPAQMTSSNSTPQANESSTSSSSNANASKSMSRGRRAYNSAMSRLSNFATAMMDVGMDSDDTFQNGNGNDQDGNGNGKESPPRATYSFSGDDGNGVDLTKGRVRMTVNLPLVTSSHSNARRLGTPQLVSDFETPFVRIRHKLRVKLGFGFGEQPLGGEGQWGQALVMCVPVSI